MSAPLLEVRGLCVDYAGPHGRVPAVIDASLELRAGATLGLVGESGCGKSSLARAVVGLVRPRSGSVRLDGRECVGSTRRARRQLAGRLQMVFQDPYSSLDPRMTVAQIVAEPLVIAGRRRGEVEERVVELMGLVGLDPDTRRRYPHEFSGGQCQRVGIARALALEPALLILDEPVSALDVSVQAQVLNLLQDIQERLGLAYLFISHHLAVVRHVSDRVAVMEGGRIVEQADRDTLFGAPAHAYTRELLSAVPVPDPDAASVSTPRGAPAS